MTVVDFEGVALQHLVTHHVGNKLRGESYVLSNEATSIEQGTESHLLKYFLDGLKTEEWYSFTHPLQVDMNEVYTVVKEMFAEGGNFIKLSQDIAKLLYEHTTHPKVAEGELNIAYFSGIVYNGEETDAVGIYKSETNVPYLKMNASERNFYIHHDFGFEIKAIDKACLIINTDADSGFCTLVADNARKGEEAKYWKDDFLQLKPISNEFHQTKHFLNIAKEFVANKITEEFEISKTDKIDLLNRSLEYFRNTDNFDKKEFESAVFVDPDLIDSFNKFGNQYKEDNQLELKDKFEISTAAVKKQARVFKSVLKLDGNFHVYIHGNREMIEQGIDKDGRKFYKLYFEHEE
jgi:37-kD nucleoid-associated bacterial protein